MMKDIVRADIAKVLFPEEKIKHRVVEMGRVLAKDYAQKKPLVLGTLTGAFIFTADLVRAMEPCPEGLDIAFCQASSYGSSTMSSGKVVISQRPHITMEGRNVVIVEDIVDTGSTLAELMNSVVKEGALSVECVALLNKQARRASAINAKYVGFECPDEFVVGYGLDYNQQYRSLPYIGVLEPSIYQETCHPFSGIDGEKQAQVL